MDPTYDGDGLAVLSLGEGSANIQGAALQNDDKLVVAGTARLGLGQFGVARFNVDGSADTTFSQDGKIVMVLSSNQSSGQEVAIQSDGKIVVAGFVNMGADADFAAVRYEADGSLDASFGDRGKVITSISGGHDLCYGLAIQPDGRIVMAGRASNDFALLRLMPDGAPDASFGDAGKVITAIGDRWDGASAVVLQRDRKIVVAGHAQQGGKSNFAVARYLVDGSLDTSFGNGGSVMTTVGLSTSLTWSAHGLALQPDEKILVVGKAWNGTDNDIACVRYQTDGSLDASFDHDGVLLIPVGSQQDFARGVTVQGDGKILIVGTALIDSTSDIALIRLNPDGSPDTSFGGGIVTTAVGVTHPNGSAEVVLLQSDGKILVVGRAENDIAVLRYESGWRPRPYEK